MFAFLSVDTAERRRWDETWYSQRYVPARFVHIDDGLAFLGVPTDLERSRTGPRANLAASTMATIKISGPKGAFSYGRASIPKARSSLASSTDRSKMSWGAVAWTG